MNSVCLCHLGFYNFTKLYTRICKLQFHEVIHTHLQATWHSKNILEWYRCIEIISSTASADHCQLPQDPSYYPILPTRALCAVPQGRAEGPHRWVEAIWAESWGHPLRHLLVLFSPLSSVHFSFVQLYVVVKPRIPAFPLHHLHDWPVSMHIRLLDMCHQHR